MENEPLDPTPLSYAVDPTPMGVLREIEETIKANERLPPDPGTLGIRSPHLLAYTGGSKQLPTGMLDAIAHELGGVRSEVGARVTFARSELLPYMVTS